MDFEAKLQELITVALAAGISRDAVISTLEERAAYLVGQEAEEADDDEDEETPAA